MDGNLKPYIVKWSPAIDWIMGKLLQAVLLVGNSDMAHKPSVGENEAGIVTTEPDINVSYAVKAFLWFWLNTFGWSTWTLKFGKRMVCQILMLSLKIW